MCFAPALLDLVRHFLASRLLGKLFSEHFAVLSLRLYPDAAYASVNLERVP